MSDVAEDSLQYAVDVCRAIVQVIGDGVGVRLDFDREGDELTISFKLADADRFHAAHRLIALSRGGAAMGTP